MYVADTFHTDRGDQRFAVHHEQATVPPIWSLGTRGSGTNQFIKPWDLVFDPRGTVCS